MDLLCISVGMTMTGGYVLLPAVHHMSSSVNQPPASWRAFTHTELICRSRACLVCCCVPIKRSRCSHGVFLLTRSRSMIGKTQPKRKGLRTSVDMFIHSTSPLPFPKPSSYKSPSPPFLHNPISNLSSSTGSTTNRGRLHCSTTQPQSQPRRHAPSCPRSPWFY